LKKIAPLIFLVSLLACKDNGRPKTFNGLSPQEALKGFRIPEGFRIDLVASEPMISDPVAMEVDENGNIYVLEMHGYPLDTSGTGKIKLLTDTNGDGLPDKSEVFADHLRLPTGIMRWKKGLIVVDVPDVLYLEDSNHDGMADIKKKIITGIALTNPQHVANTPIFGIDNWIYLAHMGTVTPKVSMMFNDSGSLVRFVDAPEARTLPRNADGRNIRFNVDKLELEMLSGESQYGQSFDNWGHHFCVENADHIFEEVIAAKYLNRNPALLVANASDYISDHGGACEVYPITVNPENQLLTDRGVVTSACGITYYNGGLFPDSFNNFTFVAEPVSNIVHVDRIQDHGASFTASRVYPEKEFLASTDGWFRPVQIYVGPDGALYVIDYYRQIIEHPEWLSEEVIQSGALYNGSEKGRIYRIVPAGASSMKWCNHIDLGRSSTEELVRTLTNKNIWWRRNAQRLLMDRKDGSSVHMLQKLIDTATSAAGIAHALWTLEGLGEMDTLSLVHALGGSSEGVRENAIRIAERHLNDMPSLAEKLLRMQNDPSARVRFQLLCSLGDLNTQPAIAAEQRILIQDINDKWVHIAALSAAGGREWTLLQNTLPTLSARENNGSALFFSNCAAVMGMSGRTDDINNLIALATGHRSMKSSWWQAALLNGLGKSLRIKPLSPNGQFEKAGLRLLNCFEKNTPPSTRKAAVALYAKLDVPSLQKWKQVIGYAEAIAADTMQSPAFREDALEVLALNKGTDYAKLFEEIIISEGPVSLQQSALEAFNHQSPTDAAKCIVKNWKIMPKGLRKTGVEAMLSSMAGMNMLLEAVKSGEIQTSSISWPGKVELMNNDNDSIRRKARQLLASEIESREAVIDRYQSALTEKGDSLRGLAVYQTVCASCHLYQGKYGTSIGPDLATISNRDKSSILKDILDPNRSIAVKYDLWIITQRSGKKESGIICSESSTSITLCQPGGGQIIIGRNEIKSMETAETSAMPVGLESAISIEQMTDLLAFLSKRN